jgi:hypothetical protein
VTLPAGANDHNAHKLNQSPALIREMVAIATTALTRGLGFARLGAEWSFAEHYPATLAVHLAAAPS